jgi:hypothetical protein
MYGSSNSFGGVEIEMLLGWWLLGFHIMRTLALGRWKVASNILVVKQLFFRIKNRPIFELEGNCFIPTARIPGNS